MLTLLRKNREDKRFSDIYVDGTVSPVPLPYICSGKNKNLSLLGFCLCICKKLMPASRFRVLLEDYIQSVVFEIINNSVLKKDIFSSLSILVIIKRHLDSHTTICLIIRDIVSKVRYTGYLHDIFNNITNYKEKIENQKSVGIWIRFTKYLSEMIDGKKNKVILIFPSKEYEKLVSEFISATISSLFKKQKISMGLILESKNPEEMKERYEETMISLIPEKCGHKILFRIKTKSEEYILKCLNSMEAKDYERVIEKMPPFIYDILITKRESKKIIIDSFKNILKNPEKSDSIMMSAIVRASNPYGYKKNIDNYHMLENIKLAISSIKSPEVREIICNSLPDNIRRSLRYFEI